LLDDELGGRQVAAIADGFGDDVRGGGLGGEELAFAGALVLPQPGGVERAEVGVGVDPTIKRGAADTGKGGGVGHRRVLLVEPLDRLALGFAESRQLLGGCNRGLGLAVARSVGCG
jgi:hypothetical protein